MRTITLIEREGSFHFVDHPPRQGVNAAPLAADEFVGSTPVFTRAGRRAGTLDFHCVFVTGGERGRMHCTGTYSLAGGTIAAQAVFRGFESVPTIAITGGTGAYEGARGSISSRDRRTSPSAPFASCPDSSRAAGARAPAAREGPPCPASKARDHLQVAIKVIDGNRDPWLVPSIGLFVN